MAQATKKSSLGFWLVAIAIFAAWFVFLWPISDERSLLGVAVTAFTAACLTVCLVLLPALFISGVGELRRRRERELKALGDENTVTADPEGPRKLHEYLTAITSTEARIGLLQRSEPYPGDKPQS